MNKEQEILKKAKELFMKYGFRSITMDDLAHHLSFSKKTLYQYYKDKADLIRKIIITEISEMAKMMESIIENIVSVFDDYDYEKILNEIFDYHIRAISTAKGLEYYENNFKNVK